METVRQIIEIRTSGQEIGCVEVPEHCESVGDDTEGTPEHTPYRQPGLKSAEVDELCAVNPLNLQTLVEL